LTGATIQSNADRESLLVANRLEIAARPYLGNTDARAPLASPLFGEFAGLPLLIFFFGESEILLDDARRTAEKARAAQNVAYLRVWPDVPHVWQLADGFIPEARRSMDEAVVETSGSMSSAGSDLKA
jgi:monoterpene epsilon-lactone hydrolase